MSAQRIQITAGFILALVIALAIIQGCGEITGDFYANQSPVVEFVNVPGDAYGVDTTYHYGMPFDVPDYGVDITILDMQGSLMIENSEIVYALDGFEEPDTIYFTFGQDYEIDYGDESDPIAVLRALQGGAMTPDQTYYIDFQFIIENYYIFSFAPTVYWKGTDPDGFVEYYRYADVYDPAFIADFRVDPQGTYAAHQHEFNWVDTTAMSARIYLLTATGDTTEHVVFIKAVDNQGSESNNLEFKTFFRSNNAPNNPQIKPLELADTEYALNFVVEDTVFCLDEITPLWPGISYNWRSDDPDDMELYQIPLEFSYYLVKTPGDTLWDKSNPNWSETTQIQLFGLETGSYVFSVWVRDDGLTLSTEPATIQFKTVKPTFEHHILLIDETVNAGLFEVEVNDIATFYLDLLENIEGTLENDNYVMDGVDVRLLDNSDSNTSRFVPIPYSVIGQYQLVMIFADDHTLANAEYVNNRNEVLADFLDIGGRLWFIGRRVLGGEFGFPNGLNVPVDGFANNYLQIETGFASNRQDLQQAIEFIGGIPVIREEFPELQIDTSRVAELNGLPSDPNTALMEIDWYTRSDEAVTLYTFNSNTADTVVTNPYVYGDDATVLPGATQERCSLIPTNTGLLDVFRVENVTKNALGTVEGFSPDTIWVSYQSEPWSDSDSLSVDYKYDPISDMHLKPVAIRYEAQPRILTTIELGGNIITFYTYTLGYRTSVFGFPLYFMDNSNGEVEDVVRTMLNWFFYPMIHWEL
jgi:hypothetical protein